MIKLIKRTCLATVLATSFTLANALAFDNAELDNAELNMDDLIDYQLPAPNIYPLPNFDFTDCHGRQFNTKVMQEQEQSQSEEAAACSVQGIVNTKFSFNPNSKVQKTALELDENEKKYVMDNLTTVDPKAVFAYFVYLTVTQLPEYNFLLDKAK